jgi:DNA mismatch endonuclease (patch repair protein)
MPEEVRMADTRTPEQRSRIMASVRSRDTGPEKRVRSFLHRMGYRFRLHVRDLPGRPDIVLPRHQTAIFIHGCFWHGHKGCRKGGRPKSNVEFWTEKIEKNIMRDAAAIASLRALGWKVLVIWQCELRNEGVLRNRIERFFASSARS